MRRVRAAVLSGPAVERIAKSIITEVVLRTPVSLERSREENGKNHSVERPDLLARLNSLDHEDFHQRSVVI